jgi:phenylpyruvate tautomerase PptA (4-oxalocrotonate tautomerase family)
VPHVSIKHFPVSLEEKQREDLVAAVTKAVTDAFGCPEGVVSIAIEPVPEARWNDSVYVPEIVNRRDLLSKIPNY